MARPPTGREPINALHRLSTRHRDIMFRLAGGQRPTDIASEIGMSQSHLSVVMNSPIFKREFRALQAEIKGKLINQISDVEGQIQKFQPQAIKTIAGFMNNPKMGASLRRQCANDLLALGERRKDRDMQMRAGSGIESVAAFLGDVFAEAQRRRSIRLAEDNDYNNSNNYNSDNNVEHNNDDGGTGNRNDHNSSGSDDHNEMRLVGSGSTQARNLQQHQQPSAEANLSPKKKGAALQIADDVPQQTLDLPKDQDIKSESLDPAGLNPTNKTNGTSSNNNGDDLFAELEAQATKAQTDKGDDSASKSDQELAMKNNNSLTDLITRLAQEV